MHVVASMARPLSMAVRIWSAWITFLTFSRRSCDRGQTEQGNTWGKAPNCLRSVRFLLLLANDLKNLCSQSINNSKTNVCSQVESVILTKTYQLNFTASSYFSSVSLPNDAFTKTHKIPTSCHHYQHLWCPSKAKMHHEVFQH